MTLSSPPQKIVIIGGGFGGVRAALDLHNKRLPVCITLITDKPYLEYHAALYRVVTGHSPMEACIPYREIFDGTSVKVIIDKVATVDLRGNVVHGDSGFTYRFDSLVIAVGCETAYFGIPGVKEKSHGMKSANEALELKRHLHEIFEAASKHNESQAPSGRIVIIGGGASGVELAGELAVYAKTIAKKHKLPSSMIAIDLIEAMPRLLPTLPESVSQRVLKRLQSLGVNVLLARKVLGEEDETVSLQDMQVQTKTVVWTAGLKASSLLSAIEGLIVDARGKAIVDDYLQSMGHDDVYVIGDAAATQYSGMAQTAVRDGAFVAECISRKMQNKTLYPSVPALPVYAMPVGSGWAVVVWGRWKVYGRLGWLLRRAADMKVYLSMLSPRRAVRAYLSGGTMTESCPVCCSSECVC